MVPCRIGIAATSSSSIAAQEENGGEQTSGTGADDDYIFGGGGGRITVASGRPSSSTGSSRRWFAHDGYHCVGTITGRTLLRVATTTNEKNPKEHRRSLCWLKKIGPSYFDT